MIFSISFLARHRRIHTNTNPAGRGARNSAAAAAAQVAKNAVTSSMVLTPNSIDAAAAAAMAAAASNKTAAVPSIAQQFSSIGSISPAGTLQLTLPVSMAQIRGAAALGPNQNWVPLAHQVEHHRGGASEQKSPNDTRQQTIGVSVSPFANARVASTQELEYLFAPSTNTTTFQQNSHSTSIPMITPALFETVITKIKHEEP